MRRWRQSIVLFLAGALVAGSGTMVIASGRSSGTPVDHMANAWASRAKLTTFGHWQNVPGLDLQECASGNVSAALTMELDTSGAFRLRVLVDGADPLKPNAVGNIPLNGNPMFMTPTFVGTVPNGMHTFSVQWKVLSGSFGLELHRAALNLLYGHGSC